jgi:hypothetical protein
MKRFPLTVILVASLLFSCGDTTNNKMIVGEWQASEWMINGQPSVQNARNTSFRFKDNNEYTFINSGIEESGTYKIENNMLFTTAKGQQEMMVKIAKLTNDSLVFDMNRGGQGETLTLLRSKK